MLPRDGVDTEPLGPCPAGRRSRKRSVQPRCDGRRILRRYDERPVETSQRLRQPAYRGRDDRSAAGERLEHHQPKALERHARDNRDVRRPVRVDQRRVIDPAEEPDTVAESQAIDGSAAELPPRAPPPRSTAACRLGRLSAVQASSRTRTPVRGTSRRAQTATNESSLTPSRSRDASREPGEKRSRSTPGAITCASHGVTPYRSISRRRNARDTVTCASARR